MKKNKSKLPDYLKLYTTELILNCKSKTIPDVVDEILNMPAKKIIGQLPSGILEYLKKIDV